MKSITFLIPYFGKLPNTFQIFLESCRYNNTVSFIVYTDDLTEFDYPPNVVRKITTLEAVKEKAQTLFGFPIKLESAYKLCDYRPAYGEIFSDDLIGVDYWGWCDIDIFWGHIRNFLTEAILDHGYKRILTRGHCSLFLNDSNVNSLYRTLPNCGCLRWENVYSSHGNMIYDEWAEHVGGYSKILALNGIEMYDEMVFADINFLKYRFVTSRSLTNKYCHERDWKKTIYVLDNSGLFAEYLIRGRLKRTEFMYIHLQKRTLRQYVSTEISKRVAIIPPNRIVDAKILENRWSRRLLVREYGLNFDVFRFRIKQIKRKIRHSQIASASWTLAQ